MLPPWAIFEFIKFNNYLNDKLGFVLYYFKEVYDKIFLDIKTLNNKIFYLEIISDFIIVQNRN